jgi:hypothetical protein
MTLRTVMTHSPARPASQAVTSGVPVDRPAELAVAR